MITSSNTSRERLSIDVHSEEHRKIKAYAALNGQTIREFVLNCVRAHLNQTKTSPNHKKGTK